MRTIALLSLMFIAFEAPRMDFTGQGPDTTAPAPVVSTSNQNS